MTCRWLAVVGLVAWPAAGCKIDPIVERDIVIEEVVAQRDGEKVALSVFVRNMGDGRGTSVQLSKACVKAMWQTEGRILATADGCGSRFLYPDDSDVIALSVDRIPTAPERVVIRVDLTNGGCDDCFQDPGDTEWTLLSP